MLDPPSIDEDDEEYFYDLVARCFDKDELKQMFVCGSLLLSKQEIFGFGSWCAGQSLFFWTEGI